MSVRATHLLAPLWVLACNARAAEPSPLTPRFHIAERVKVVERVRPDAKACVVHFHGNEVPGREVMLAHAARARVNVIYLEDVRRQVPWGDDRIPVPSSTSETHACSVNPNRVLTDKAFAHRIDFDCDNDAMARVGLRAFLDKHLLPALSRCRGGDAALPVITYHNNSRLTVKDMDAERALSVPGRESDILFVTDAQDYEKLVTLGQFSVALQSRPPADDGSLSALLWRARYLNVEAQIAPSNRKVNEAMSEAALRLVGAWEPADAPPPREAPSRAR